jgi:hypothetical protein
MFTDAQNEGAILVLDDAEAMLEAGEEGMMSSCVSLLHPLFLSIWCVLVAAGNKEGELQEACRLLLHHISRYSGIAILMVTLPSSRPGELLLPQKVAQFVKFRVAFPEPNVACRLKLWQSLLPARTPRAAIDFQMLAERFELVGSRIRNCLFQAAGWAALRPGGQQRITQEDLERAAEEETSKDSERIRDEVMKAMFF